MSNERSQGSVAAGARVRVLVAAALFASSVTPSSAAAEAAQGVKVYVEAVDSIDFPTITAYFRVLDLNPETPYREVTAGEVSLAEGGAAVEVVPGSFEVRTRPISAHLVCDGSESLVALRPCLRAALTTFADKLGQYGDKDEVAISRFSDVKNQCHNRLLLDFTDSAEALRLVASQQFGEQQTGMAQNPEYCSSIWTGFHEGVAACAQRSADQGLPADVRNLPRMVVALTDGKDDPTVTDIGVHMDLEPVAQFLRSSQVPCFIVAAGILMDEDQDRRVVNLPDLQRLGDASEGAVCVTTDGGGSDARGAMIGRYFDKIISSYKKIYRVRFTTADERIGQTATRQLEVRAIGGTGTGNFLPPVVVDEDLPTEISYPLAPEARGAVGAEVTWSLSYHRGMDQPRARLEPVPQDQRTTTVKVPYAGQDALTLVRTFRIPTNDGYVPPKGITFSDLREPHFRYGVKVAPHELSEREELQGRLLGAFPVYVCDTTPPSLRLRLRTRDSSTPTELAMLEEAGADRTFDQARLPGDRKLDLTVDGAHLTPDGAGVRLDGVLAQPALDLVTAPFAGGPTALYVQKNVPLVVDFALAKDNMSFASPAGALDPRDTVHEELLAWYDYRDLPAARPAPRAIDFTAEAVAGVRDHPAPCLPHLTWSELQTPASQGGKAGLCWWLERGSAAEYVRGSDCFESWIEHAANVRGEAGLPFVPGDELYLKVVARDRSGNEASFRCPVKILPVEMDLSCLAYQAQRLP